MIPNDFLDKLATRIDDLLPENSSAHLKKSIHALLESTFSKLDLVTREEFDVQKEVLLRTREKVDLLQLQLDKLADNDG